MFRFGLVNIVFSVDLGLGNLFVRGRKRRELQALVDTANTETYLCKQLPDGTDRLEQITDVKKIGRIDSSDVCVHLTTAGIPLELTCAGLRDLDGTELDVTISATWRICDRELFLRDYGWEQLRTSSTINITSVESMLAARCRQRIAEEVRQQKYQSLTSHDALSPRDL